MKNKNENPFKAIFGTLDSNPGSKQSELIILAIVRLEQKKGRKYLIAKIEENIDYVISFAQGTGSSSNLASELFVIWLTSKKLKNFDSSKQKIFLEVLIGNLASPYKESNAYRLTVKLLQDMPVSVLQNNVEYLIGKSIRGCVDFQIVSDLLAKVLKTGFLDGNSVIQGVLEEI